MSYRHCLNCIFNQYLQLNIFCSLIKVLFNFLTSLQSVFSLHFICTLSSSSISKSQSIADADSVQSEYNKVLNKIV